MATVSMRDDRYGCGLNFPRILIIKKAMMTVKYSTGVRISNILTQEWNF